MRGTVVAGLVICCGVVLAGPLDDAYDRYKTLVEQGKSEEALPFAIEAVRISEQDHGHDEQTTAIYYNNLGLLYKDLADFTKAESFLEQALTINEKADGAPRPELAASLTNLGLLYFDMGDHAKAKPLLERALAITERVVGDDHPSMATSLNNLGTLRKKMGDYAAAESLYRRALVISERELGPDHPHVATLLNNLGATYEAPEEYAKAEPLFRRALVIYEDRLGAEHPATKRAALNLEMFLLVRGLRKWTDATGRFSREARLVEVSEGVVTLILANGKKSRIAMEKLSNEDQAYIAAVEKKRKTISAPRDSEPFK